MSKNRIVVLAAALTLTGIGGFAAPAKISISVDQPGHKIAPTLWGIFFEDINLSADGGLYPELVRNRSFEDADTPESWRFTSVSGNNAAKLASSARDGKSGDIIVKIVNTAATATESEIEFSGAGKLAAEATAVVLTSDKPTDENSLAQPEKVSPKSETWTVAGKGVTHVFPANSFTVLRIHAQTN